MLAQEEVFVIHDLHHQGLSVRAIARRLGLDRNTVRKYLRSGLQAPRYGPRVAMSSLLDPYRAYLQQRLTAYPELTATRLLREIRNRGYPGSYTIVKQLVRELRPPVDSGFEHRFETPAGEQAQVDFAYFRVVFTDEPTQVHVVWLFTMVLGCSRMLFGRFVLHQDLETLLRCHVMAFERFGGVPRTTLYDRMRAAVVDEDADGRPLFNAKLLDLASHYGFTPKACQPYRAKTKGKVERPYRYVRQDFFLGREFANLEDLNGQLDAWLAEVANCRVHGTTRRCVQTAFEEERPHLQPLPPIPYRAVLRLQRRISRDGLVSVDGNQYSVPDTTRHRVVEVHSLLQEIQIFDAGHLVAVHTPREGRGHIVIATGHRRFPPPGNAKVRRTGPEPPPLQRPGEQILVRPLDIYDNVATALAQAGRDPR